jgi:hypothetical protein
VTVGKRRRALCCTCGTTRTLSVYHHLRNGASEVDPKSRMLGDLRCQTCGAVTRRALLHEHEPDYRNLAEDEDHARMLPREIDRQPWRDRAPTS